MAKEKVEALIEPALLVWARKTAGLTMEMAAKKMQIKPDRLLSWESGKARPSIPQLRNSGLIYKRPIAVFYLSNPPNDFTPLRDFRRISGEEEKVLSPELQLEIRLVMDRRLIAIDLYKNLDYQPPQMTFNMNSMTDQEILASKIRSFLGVTRDKQVKFHDDRESFNWWRSSLENRGVLVFQTTDVKLSEMRGFSIGEMPLSVIVINNKDSQRGRVFTMLHEFTHILLKQSGLCDLSEEVDHYSDKQDIEVFCNRVAGAILVEKEDLLLEEVVLEKRGEIEWSNDEISLLANKYKVSREVIVRRLLICGCTSQEFYQRKRKEFEKEYADLKGKKQEGFLPPHLKSIVTAGSSFVRLVLENYHRDNITTSDVSDFLNIKLKHLKKIESVLTTHIIKIKNWQG